MPALVKILNLLATQGQMQYGGEPVTQLDHALQCATMAQVNDASSELIVACLFHDLGHLIHGLGEDVANLGIDDRHEYSVLSWLRPLFGPGVTEPIRLHVEAKRYLCATQIEYWEQLSVSSQLSLTLQGGPFLSSEVDRFLAQPHAQAAIQLRCWDEQAKVPGLATHLLSDFIPLLERVVVQR